MSLSAFHAICEKYKKMDDELSLEIHAWNQDNPNPTRKAIAVLAFDILIDPISRKSLENPILDGKWVWEAKILTFYQSCFFSEVPISPYHGGPIEEKAHVFAKEIIAYIKRVMSSDSLMHTSTSVVPVDREVFILPEKALSLDDPLRFVFALGIRKLAKGVIRVSLFKKATRKIEKSTESMVVLRKETELGAREIRRDTERIKEESKHSSDEDLSKIKHTYKEIIDKKKQEEEELKLVGETAKIDLKEATQNVQAQQAIYRSLGGSI